MMLETKLSGLDEAGIAAFDVETVLSADLPGIVEVDAPELVASLESEPGATPSYLCGCPSCLAPATGSSGVLTGVESGDGEPSDLQMAPAAPPPGTAYYIAALMNSATQADWNSEAGLGGFWNNGRFALEGTPTWGNGASLTYSFTSALPSDYNSLQSGYGGYSTFTDSQKAVVQTTLTLISSYTNLSFTEVTDSALVNDPIASDMRFQNTTQASSGGFGLYPGWNLASDTTSGGKAEAGESGMGGDVFMANGPAGNDLTSAVAGNYAYAALIHEIGHALGLKHTANVNAGGGGAAGPYLPTGEESGQYTVMSYTRYAGHATGGTQYFTTTMSMYDIAALQFVYGVNTNTNSGDDVHTIDVSGPQILTFWDPSGRDLLDLSNQTTNMIFELKQAGFGSMQGLTNNIAFAYGTIIEDFIGGSGNDTVTGGDEANVIEGRGGADALYGGWNDDTLRGGDGNDRLDGGNGNDAIDGEANDDVVLGGDGNDFVLGGAGADTLEGEGDNDALLGQEGDDSLYGSTGNDLLAGGFGLDRLFGGSGDDTVKPGGGADTAYGGSGTDLLSYSDGATGFVVNFTTGTAVDIGGGNHTAHFSEVEIGEGSNYADTLLTGAGVQGQTLFGLAGGDILDSGGRADGVMFYGGDDGDILYGGGGNDRLDGGQHDDYMAGGAGNDTYYVDGNWDVIVEQASGGEDTVVASALFAIPDHVEWVQFSGVIDPNFTGGSGRDYVYGDSQRNTIDGAGGDDTIDGGSGSDVIYGGIGNDLFSDPGNTFGSGDTVDTYYGGAGVDTLDLTRYDYGLVIDLPTFRAFHWVVLPTITYQETDEYIHEVERILGTDFTDTMYGSSVGEAFFGGAGVDTLFGGGGDDLLAAGSGAGIAIGGDGADTFTADLTINDLHVDGGADNDKLVVDFAGATDAISYHPSGYSPVFGNHGPLLLTDFGGGRSVAYRSVEQVTVFSGVGDDYLVGGGLTDVFVSHTGDDLMVGGGGVDSFFGGAGVDRVHQTFSGTIGVALDLEASQTAAQTLADGSQWSDIDSVSLQLAAGDDTVDLRGIDTGETATEAQVVRAGDGADTVKIDLGSHGTNHIDGEGGSDVLIVDYSAATGAVAYGPSVYSPVFGNHGPALSTTFQDIDHHVIYRGIDAVTVSTGAGNDYVVGGTLTDVFTTGAGDDWMTGNGGIDSFFGGAGVDQAQQTFAGSTGVNLNLLASQGAIQTLADNSQWEKIEAVWFWMGSGADTVDIRGVSATPNVPFTGPANLNMVVAGEGDDTFALDLGAHGVNHYDAGGGTDKLIVDYSAATADVSYAASVYSDVFGNHGPALSTTFADVWHAVIYRGVDAVTASTGAGNDYVVGGTLTDVFTTGAGNDWMTGNGGVDSFFGGAGVDQVQQTFAGSTGVNLNLLASQSAIQTLADNSQWEKIEAVWFWMGSGADTVDIRGVSATPNVPFTGPANLNMVVAGEGDDTFALDLGAHGVNHYDAGGGTDKLIVDYSAATADVSYAASVYSDVFGNHGPALSTTFADVLHAIIYRGVDAVTVSTGAGNDYVVGGALTDVFTAGAGDDWMNGGGGLDSFFGGGGVDHVMQSFGGTIGINLNLLASQTATQTLLDGSQWAKIESVSLSLGAGSDVVDVRGVVAAPNAPYAGPSNLNVVHGGEGNDSFALDLGAHGVNHYAAGGGTDKLIVDYSAATDAVVYESSRYSDVFGNHGPALSTTFADVFHAVIYRDVDAVTVSTGVGNDYVVGGVLTDVFATGAGDDWMIGNGGVDSFFGGGGVDHVMQSFGGTIGINLNLLASQTATQTLLDGSQWAKIESVSLSLGAGSDVVDVRGVVAAPNAPYAGPSNLNVVHGGEGNDSFALDLGAHGVNHYAAGGGTDKLIVDYSAATDAVVYESSRYSDVFGNHGPALSTTFADVLHAVIYRDVDAVTVSTGAGNDYVVGGVLTDVFTAGAGDDWMIGNGGVDSFFGGAGVDHVMQSFGGTIGINLNLLAAQTATQTLADSSQWDKIESVSLALGAGSDVVDVRGVLATPNVPYAGPANLNVVRGGDGNDTFALDLGAQGVNHYDGEGGDDTLIADWRSATDAISFVGSAYSDVFGNHGPSMEVDGSRVLYRSVESLVVSAGSGDDALFGGGGGDVLDGGEGDDSLVGNGGEDAASFAHATSGIVANLSSSTATGAGNDVLSGIENLIGSSHNDTLTGDGGANKLYGAGGSDSLYGGAGNDALFGGIGDDVLDAGQGDADTVYGGDGIDRLRLDFSDLTTAVDVASSGASGSVTVMRGAMAHTVTFEQIEQRHIIGGSAADTLRGGAGIDTLDGGVGSDSLYGGDGEDVLMPGTGVDFVDGGAGIDLLRANYAALGTAVTMVVSGGGGGTILAGANTVNFVNVEARDVTGGSGDDILRGGSAGDTFAGGDGLDRLFGGTGDDVLSGGAGIDTVDGGAGADTMRGGAGNDVYFVDNLGDVLDETTVGSDGLDLVAVSVDGYTVGAGVERINMLVAAGQTVSADGVTDNAFYGGVGADLIYGGAGNDSAIGGDGADRLYGGSENDGLFGGLQNDTLYGGDGNDVMDGGTGNDVMVGGAGDDVYTVDSLADVANEAAPGSDGTDTINLGVAGFAVNAAIEHIYVLGLAGMTVSGGGATDNHIYGGLGDDRLNGGLGTGVDMLYGGAAQDKLFGGAGNDQLYGAAGQDSLLGEAGADFMAGGAGNDYYFVDDIGDVIDETSAGSSGADTVFVSTADYTIGDGVERANMQVAAGGRIVADGGGAHTLSGGVGADTFYGGDGSDLLTALAGADTLYGGAGNDRLTGGDGTDALYGGADADTLDGGVGADVMAGGGGNDIYFADNSSDAIDETSAGSDGFDIVFVNTTTYVAGEGVERINVKTTPGASVMAAGATDNLVFGGVGNDSLDGGDGVDTVVGGNGDDSLSGGSGDDRLDGGIGNDGLDGGDGNDVLLGGAGNDAMRGGAGDDTFYVHQAADQTDEFSPGSGGDDLALVFATGAAIGEGVERITVQGVAGLFVSAGGATDNTMTGGVGNDTLASGAGNDTALGLNGADALLGGVGNDLLDGGAGNDSLNGGDGIDVLLGGLGNDTLTGGNDDDTMSGGGGIDTFRKSANEGNDTITDFRLAGAADKVDLTGITVTSAFGATTVTFSDGTSLTSTNGYLWQASDFV